MPGIKQVKFKILEITFVGIGSLRRENVIVFTPYYKSRWLILAEICLPFGIIRYVVLVIIEQCQLNGRIPFTGQVAQINIPVVRTDCLRKPGTDPNFFLLRTAVGI